MKMKFWALLVALFLILSSSSFSTAEEIRDSIVPFADVKWDYSKEDIVEKNEALFKKNGHYITVIDSGVVTSVDINGLYYSLVFQFNDDKLNSIIATNFSIGEEENRENCEIEYNRLSEYVSNYLCDAKVECIDKWTDDESKLKYENDVSYAMCEGYLSRGLKYETAESEIVVYFMPVTGSVNMGLSITPVEKEPETFDISYFKERDNFFWVAEDEMENKAYINLNGYDGENRNTEIEDSYTQTGFSQCIVPDIIVLNRGKENETPILRIWIHYYAKNWLFADTCIIKLGDNTYTFENIGVTRKADYNSIMKESFVKETLLLLPGGNGVDFMEDLCSYKGDVKMRIKGDNGYIDFDITGNTWPIERLYRALQVAHGTEPQYLSQFDGNIK